MNYNEELLKVEEEPIKKISLNHEIIIYTIFGLIVRCILRYVFMAAYIYTAKYYGFYDYGIVPNIVITITSICVCRIILRELGKIIGDRLGEEPLETVGFIHCVRGIKNTLSRW